MSTTIEPTVGRIVWYRDKDGAIRAAIVVGVNSTFNLNLFVFGYSSSDRVGGYLDSVTHADPEQEPGCKPSWHWMPYQKQQAKKHANEIARAESSELMEMTSAQFWRAQSDRADALRRAAQAGARTSIADTRIRALDMALRTAGSEGHDAVLKAARSYQEYIDGQPAPKATDAALERVAAESPGIAQRLISEREWRQAGNNLLGPYSGLTFGGALDALKAGKRVARAGWNGKGMFAYLVPANAYPAQTGAARAFFGDGALVPYNAYLALKGADDTVSTWAPSGSDALAEDWLIVE